MNNQDYQNLIKYHNDLYKQQGQAQITKEVMQSPVVINNKLEARYLQHCFVKEELLYIPVYDLNNERVGYHAYDEDNGALSCYDMELPRYTLISSFEQPFKVINNSQLVINHDETTQVFFAPFYLVGSSFFNLHAKQISHLGHKVIIIIYFGKDHLDTVVQHMNRNLRSSRSYSFIFNNTHGINYDFFADNASLYNPKTKFYYPEATYQTWLDYSLTNQVDYINTHVPKVITNQLIAPPYPPITQEILDQHYALSKKKTLNFIERAAADLAEQYTNIPQDVLTGILRNIVGNTFQRLVKYNDNTPITEQSLFVISSGEGKTSLCEALTDRITDFYNDYQYEIYQKEYADYIATKEYLENLVKENKSNLEYLKELQLQLLRNEDKKPYCQTLMQTMNTSVFSIPEEVLKGARQNWLFSDEAGATMNSTTWKGEFGNSLIQYMCGAWSDTCKLSAFKTDARNKPAGRASKNEIRNCSQGMLAMTQHGFFDKLDKEMWINGGWLARMNLYICNRAPLTIKNREKIRKIGANFQESIIHLFEMILSRDSNEALMPTVTMEAMALFDEAEFKAVEMANIKQDEDFDPIYNRMKEKATRLATIYALAEYLTSGDFIITPEIAELAIKDTWKNINNSINYIIQTRSDTFDSNPAEIEECIIKAHKNKKEGEMITIKDICKEARGKVRQNTLLKHKEVIYEYLEAQGPLNPYQKTRVLRLEDNYEVFWFDVIKTGVTRVNYKLKWREGLTNLWGLRYN